MIERRSALPGGLEIVAAGQTMCLLPQRALYLPAHETLLVADVHWQSRELRAQGVPVPESTAATLARLDRSWQASRRVSCSCWATLPARL
jgi:metallophosphoesterase superfamily enzyme